MEAEHLDFFKDIQDIRNSFRKFAENTKKDGAIIINGEIENYTELTSGLDPQVITFGLNDSCDYYPSDITFDETACASFTAMHHGTPVMDVKLHVPGMHNVSNALAAIALSLDLGISTDAILAASSDRDPCNINRSQKLSTQAPGLGFPATHLFQDKSIFR